MKRILTSALLLAMFIVQGELLAQEYRASSAQRENLGAPLAFDGESNTRWSAEFKSKTGWLEVCYDEAQSFSEVEIHCGISDLKGTPKSFQILAGEPGALKVLATITDNDRDDRVVKFKTTKARCWRLDIKSVINPRWSPTVSELRFRGAGGAKKGADSKKEVKAAVRASNPGRSGRGPEKAVDGDRRSQFESAKKGAVWLEREFEEPQTFDALDLDVRARGGFGVAKSFRLRARTGRSWKTVLTAKDLYQNRVRLRFKTTKAKIWRLEVKEVVNARGAWRLGEFRLLQLGEGDFAADAPIKVDPKKVNEAIDRGGAWLEKKRGKDGNWKTSHTKEYPMGVMALCGLALKKSGKMRDDPLMLDLAARLEKMENQKVYSVALHILYLRALSKKRYNDRIQQLSDWLIEKQGPDGLWGYPTGRTDLSNAQYALLALKAAREVGCKIPSKAFAKSLDWLCGSAQKDGGFNYVPHGAAAKDPATGSMTAAGLACLDICRQALGKDRGRQVTAQKTADRAFEWLDDRFVVEMNPNSHQSHYYYLYGIERVGAFYKRKEIGGIPWYPAGARHLLDWQSRNGSWYDSIEDTCFALLFLNRASLTE